MTARDPANPIPTFIGDTCPDLGPEELKRAEENLGRYLEIVTRMAERLEREAREKARRAEAD